MRKLFLVMGIIVYCVANCQVGINTTTPSTTFEIHANKTANIAEGFLPPKISADSLQLKDSLYGNLQDGAMVYVTSPVTKALASLKTQHINAKGYYIYDANYLHPDLSLGLWRKMTSDAENAVVGDAFSAKKETGISLLSLGINLLGAEFKTISLDNSTIDIDLGIEHLNSNNQYVVPEKGLYMIHYYFKFGQGITAQLLSSQRPSIAISKTSNGTTALLDYSSFGGVQLLNLESINLPLIGTIDLGTANVSLTEGQISHVYQLDSGELLNFGVITGGLNLSLLGDAAARISIVKIG